MPPVIEENIHDMTVAYHLHVEYDEDFQEIPSAKNNSFNMSEGGLHVNDEHISQIVDLMTCLGVPLVEENLGDDKLNENLPMDSLFLEFKSFSFGSSNAISATNIIQEGMTNQQEQERCSTDNGKIENPLQDDYEYFQFECMKNEELLQPKASQDLEKTKMQVPFCFEADMGHEFLEYEVFHFHERVKKYVLEIVEYCDQPILEHVYS